jgi:hypothetical protein
LPDLKTLLHEHLAKPGAAWAVGVLGAIAEFSWTEDDTVALRQDGGRLVAGSAKGAISIDLEAPLTPIAYESLGAKADAWSQTVALCRPAAYAGRRSRDTLAECGPDDGALVPGDGIRFDLGVGSPWIEAGIRTADPALIEVLRGQIGRHYLEPGNPALDAVKRASPPRVFETAVARVEVYQPIGSTSRNIPTPEGPHTHILPGLLKTGRSHAATAPIPDGLVPVLWLYPESPLTDARGGRKPFDRAAFDRFQDLVGRFGAPGYAAAKRALTGAVHGGTDPAAFGLPADRAGRLATRVALRQMLHTDPDLDLTAWRARHDTLDDRADPHAA